MKTIRAQLDPIKAPTHRGQCDGLGKVQKLGTKIETLPPVGPTPSNRYAERAFVST